MNFRHIIFFMLACGSLLSACDRQKTVCSEESIGYLDDMALFPTLANPADTQQEDTPIMVEINGKMNHVDRIVTGPICNEVWSGTIYVGCDIQIAAWNEAPRFFEACDFTVEPDAVVIVAPHNNEPFYRGCSCHTGEDILE